MKRILYSFSNCKYLIRYANDIECVEMLISTILSLFTMFISPASFFIKLASISMICEGSSFFISPVKFSGTDPPLIKNVLSNLAINDSFTSTFNSFLYESSALSRGVFPVLMSFTLSKNSNSLSLFSSSLLLISRFISFKFELFRI